MGEYIILLPVNDFSGKVDYAYVEYDIREKPTDDDEAHALIVGWSWRQFKVVPVDV